MAPDASSTARDAASSARDAASSARDAASAGGNAAPSRWRQPLSFEVQCWIAWSGLLAFGLRGILVFREVGAYPPLELGAVVLATCWAIDLVRTGRALRAKRRE